MNIGIKYLLPKQKKNNGLKEGELSVSAAAVRDIVRYFTREAGVRALERELSKICRKAVKQLLTDRQAGEDKPHRITVTPKNLDKFLGVRRYTFGMAEKQNQVGQVTGLAWTEVGGEVLQIGGLKEKLLAAHRGGIKTVLIPEENVKDLVEIPDNIKNRLEIVPVKWMDQVLEVALERQPEPLSEADDSAPIPPKPDDQPGAATTH